jgi:hypothetical protein
MGSGGGPSWLPWGEYSIAVGLVADLVVVSDECIGNLLVRQCMVYRVE